MKKKIYIAGKVTGEPKHNCSVKFAKAAKEIEALGFEAVNPLEVVGTWDITWEAAMRICIAKLMECDKVYMLPCCGKSNGARIEIRIASVIKIPLVNTLEELH